MTEPIATTPEPPYTAVVFSNVRTDGDSGYSEMADRMEVLASQQPGYLGFETARTPGGLGISVSYWIDEQAARDWKQIGEHLLAQERGANRWYAEYRVRVATVTREYGGP